MNITRVDLRGDSGKFATLARKIASDLINVQIIAPGGTRDELVPARDPQARWEAAKRIQKELDGRAGSSGDLWAAAHALDLLADQ